MTAGTDRDGPFQRIVGQLVRLPDLCTEDERRTSAAYNEGWGPLQGGRRSTMRVDGRNALITRLDCSDGLSVDWALGDPVDGDGRASWQLGFVEALLPADHSRLQRLRVRALPNLSGEAPASGSMTVQRASGRTRLGLHVMPVGDSAADFGTRRVAAPVLFVDPARRVRVNAQRVALTLGLTRSEGRMAALLAEGKKVGEIARSQGWSENYVRWLVPGACWKLDVSGQVALVRQFLAADVLPGRRSPCRRSVLPVPRRSRPRCGQSSIPSVLKESTGVRGLTKHDATRQPTRGGAPVRARAARGVELTDEAPFLRDAFSSVVTSSPQRPGGSRNSKPKLLHFRLPQMLELQLLSRSASPRPEGCIQDGNLASSNAVALQAGLDGPFSRQDTGFLVIATTADEGSSSAVCHTPVTTPCQHSRRIEIRRRAGWGSAS